MVITREHLVAFGVFWAILLILAIIGTVIEALQGRRKQ